MAFSQLHNRPGRGGFTLVEMLIVLLLVAVLMGLAVLIIPNLDEKRAAARAADNLQQWLMIAKARALRDKAPRGVQLILDPNNPNFVREVQYVEQPPDFLPKVSVAPSSPYYPYYGQTAPMQLASPTPPFSTVRLLGFSEYDSNTGIGAIEPGDILQYRHGQPTNHRVLQVQKNAPDTLDLTLFPDLTAPFTVPHTEYTIIRRWRPLQGEPTMRLPPRVVIDIGKNQPYAPSPPGPAPGTYGYDNPLPTLLDPYNPNSTRAVIIMFSPQGPLTDPVRGRAILWVRHEDNVGDQTLVTVYSHTGGIVAHPVDNVLTNVQNPDGSYRYLSPFTFTEDGVGSGL
jgi:prepilin-type N-terminal cleavage/methylation domain-containing protein